LAFAASTEADDTDLEALATYDFAINGGNGDGVLGSADSVWNELKVWQDSDQDGEVDEGELKTLGEWGISEIALAYDDGTAFDDESNDVTVFGNVLHGLGSFTVKGGGFLHPSRSVPKILTPRARLDAPLCNDNAEVNNQFCQNQ